MRAPANTRLSRRFSGYATRDEPSAPASVLYASNEVRTVMDRVGDERKLDDAARGLALVTSAIPSKGPVKDALSGTWLDHPLHPMLTDLPSGFWTSAWVLDVVGGESERDAARRLIGAVCCRRSRLR
jgi:hypothetical protein